MVSFKKVFQECDIEYQQQQVFVCVLLFLGLGILSFLLNLIQVCILITVLMIIHLCFYTGICVCLFW